MDMKLEVLVLPVCDVDRAKAFYEKLGFRLDIDYAANETFRVIQFTPPRSEASIIFGKGITSARSRRRPPDAPLGQGELTHWRGLPFAPELPPCRYKLAPT